MDAAESLTSSADVADASEDEPRCAEVDQTCFQLVPFSTEFAGAVLPEADILCSICGESVAKSAGTNAGSKARPSWRCRPCHNSVAKLLAGAVTEAAKEHVKVLRKDRDAFRFEVLRIRSREYTRGQIQSYLQTVIGERTVRTREVVKELDKPHFVAYQRMHLGKTKEEAEEQWEATSTDPNSRCIVREGERFVLQRMPLEYHSDKCIKSERRLSTNQSEIADEEGAERAMSLVEGSLRMSIRGSSLFKNAGGAAFLSDGMDPEEHKRTLKRIHSDEDAPADPRDAKRVTVVKDPWLQRQAAVMEKNRMLGIVRPIGLAFKKLTATTSKLATAHTADQQQELGITEALIRGGKGEAETKTLVHDLESVANPDLVSQMELFKNRIAKNKADLSDLEGAMAAIRSEIKRAKAAVVVAKRVATKQDRAKAAKAPGPQTERARDGNKVSSSTLNWNDRVGRCFQGTGIGKGTCDVLVDICREVASQEPGGSFVIHDMKIPFRLSFRNEQGKRLEALLSMFQPYLETCVTKLLTSIGKMSVAASAMLPVVGKSVEKDFLAEVRLAKWSDGLVPAIEDANTQGSENRPFRPELADTAAIMWISATPSGSYSNGLNVCPLVGMPGWLMLLTDVVACAVLVPPVNGKLINDPCGFFRVGDARQVFKHDISVVTLVQNSALWVPPLYSVLVIAPSAEHAVCAFQPHLSRALLTAIGFVADDVVVAAKAGVQTALDAGFFSRASEFLEF